MHLDLPGSNQINLPDEQGNPGAHHNSMQVDKARCQRRRIKQKLQIIGPCKTGKDQQAKDDGCNEENTPF
ncbi:MAG TPA: hypothetical protein DEA22_09135 [Blastocatellia bacterium]|nr:hypothetical protein [Blastocatellia bacterium]